ncbi:DUF3489 domain-containing protein [Mesorhizobium sp. NZP2234]|uniref:DUF3489 domain-containing protein n=1 Tax=Mesorhizobium sp. NZP2234 TaxID=2483402 RepID=UPI001556F485|nr:DUF3489 domain-containing protein [Mesorhizobium sp. NZP2234]QKC89990.1 DUF3489 domain-containing protein [Mesorhizobium sp. NZP2234]
MKSYNVKSNAKRFARQLAAKFPGYIADEPVERCPIEVAEGKAEWYPGVAAPTKVLATGIPEEISSTAYVNGKLAEVTAARIEGHTTISGGETGEGIEAEVAKVAALRPYQQAAVDAIEAGAVVMSFPAMKAAVASKAHKAEVIDPRTMTLPAMKAAVADLPLTKSTPEEIAARRAARAARAAEPKPAKVAKTTKADTIIELVSTADGATLRDLMAATEWQAHTLRGYIAGTLRKRGHNIVAKKIKGEETRYVIPAAEVQARAPASQ